MQKIPPATIDAMRQVSTLLQAGEFATARARLEKIVEAHPGFAEAWRLLAGTRQAQGDPEGAEKMLRHALQLDPAWTPTQATLGELLLNAGRTEEAETLLRKAAMGTPPYPRAALVLARYYNDTRRPAEAIRMTEPYCRAGHLDPELVTQHVAALAATGQQEHGVAVYRELARRAPDHPAAAHALAIALDAASRHAESERAARKALDLGHRSASLQFTRARSLTGLGDFAGAESALRACLALEPRMLEAHNHLARLVWMRTGDRDAATASMDEALKRFANDDALWAAKAAILQGAGDPRAAHACLAPRVERAQAPPALLVRAGLAALEFDARAALELAERAARVVPADASARKLLVAALLGSGDAQAALPHCAALLADAPDDQYLIALQTTAWRLLDDPRYAEYCDYARLVVPQRLEAPPPWSDLASFLADLKRSLEKLHEAHAHPLLFQSLRNGTETTEDLARSEDPVIQALFKAFDAPIRDFIDRAASGPDPLRRRRGGGYRFNGSWSVRLHGSGFHASHVHPRGWISSACYIELPDSMGDARSEAGVLRFGEPSFATAPPLPSQHVVRPEAGMLVLFPSYFWHGTVPFPGDRTRLTVAFDAVPDPDT